MDGLQRLLAIESIRACKARYVRGADTKDWEVFASAFTEDAIWDLRGFTIARFPTTGEWNRIGSDFDLVFLESLSNLINWPMVGRQAIKAGAAEATTEMLSAFHRLYNPEIEVISDEAAKASWPFEETTYFSDASPVRFMNIIGHYHEDYRQVGGDWLISECRLSMMMCKFSRREA